MLKEYLHTLAKKTFNKLLLLSCMLFGILTFSQQSSVQVTTQFYPPYSLKLSDYATAVDEKLAVQLLLADITEVNRSVRLRMYIEGSGIKIKSLDFPVGETPIFLDGGLPVRLTNLDISYLFRLENLQGIAADAYSKSLPEGLYQFCFEVYDAITNVRLSQKSCTPLYLVQNDPPILNLPVRGEIVTQRDVQNIIFQWTPRHLNATNVEYEFTLKELWDNYADPQAAFQSSAPLYQATTFSPTLLYGPSEPQLLPNKRYGWQVRAISKTGISENAVFKNNGYSEIFNFIYSADCNVPQFLLSEAQSITKVKVMWQADADQTKFNIQYRKKGVKDAVWFERPVQNIEEVNLYNLQADTWYEFRVGSNCVTNFSGANIQYTYSDISEFKTPKKGENSAYNCGYVPKIEINNREPLAVMAVNEVFTAGDFPVTVKFVEGQNGSFSGWGFIVVPYLADTRLKVSFNNIKVNTDYQLIDGMVLTTYDPTWGNVTDVQPTIDAFQEIIDAIGELLNLDISNTTRERIQALINAFTNEINNQDLPNNIKEPIEEALSAVEETSTTYFNAKERYENASDNEEKEQAQREMNAAENDFKQAQTKLEQAERNRQEYIEKLQSLLKKAIVELYREGADKKDMFESEYNTLLKQSGYEDNVNESKSYTIFEMYPVEGSTIETVNDDFVKLEYEYAVYIFSKMLSETDEVTFKNFIKVASKMDVNFIAIVKTAQSENKTERETIDVLKTKLTYVFIEFLKLNTAEK